MSSSTQSKGVQVSSSQNLSAIFDLLVTIVDYGEEHCRSHKHLQQGRTNPQGLYPEWSRHRPLHFLGHSMVRTNMNAYMIILLSL